MQKKIKKILIAAAVTAAAAAAVAAVLLYCGVIHMNNPDKDRYPVRGVDVSSYQGDIDWEKLSSQGPMFAYIKATEGSSLTDPMFYRNWEAARQTGLRIGAYHFFSFESSGKAQAALFTQTVTAAERMLPPAIDVEYYGDFKNSGDVSIPDVRHELRVLADAMTEAYGMKPVIYVSRDTYESIVRDGDFGDCDIWLRSVYSGAGDGAEWTFWQFSNRHRLPGYEGREKFIDMNVFNGSAADFEAYPDK